MLEKLTTPTAQAIYAALGLTLVATSLVKGHKAQKAAEKASAAMTAEIGAVADGLSECRGRLDALPEQVGVSVSAAMKEQNKSLIEAINTNAAAQTANMAAAVSGAVAKEMTNVGAGIVNAIRSALGGDALPPQVRTQQTVGVGANAT